MKMKMKSNKMMLALVLVAALALCSVAVIANTHEESNAVPLLSGNNDVTITEDGGPVNQPFGVIAVPSGTNPVVTTFTVQEKAVYSGTLTFYKSSALTAENTIAVIECKDVSNVIFKNTAVTGGSNITVTGSTTGSIELKSGAVTVGVSAAGSTPAVPFSGSLKVLGGTIDSSATTGTVVSITTSKYVEISGTTVGITLPAVGYEFGGVDSVNGLSNEILGNELTVTKEGTEYMLAGTLAKQDINGASAVGTLVNSDYAIVFRNQVVPVTFNAGVATCAVLADYNITGLKAGTASTNAGVTGNHTGILTLNVDAKTNAYTISDKTVVVNNKALTIPATITLNGQLINKGDLKIESAITSGATSLVANYGTFYAVDGFIINPANFNGIYYKVTGTTAGSYGFATLADVVAKAGDKEIIVAGNVIVDGSTSIAQTQTLKFASKTGTPSSKVSIDGESVITVLGTFNNSSYITVASEAKLNLLAATIAAPVPTVDIDVNGTLIMKTTDVTPGPTLTKIGKVVSDVKTISTDTISTSFINLYTALAETTSGEIKLLNNATLNKSATLATGVKFLNNGNDLNIVNDVTLTADGIFQFSGANNFKIDGKLLLKNKATSDGSYIGSGSAVTLTGTITVENGVNFTSESPINTASTSAGQIEVFGTFTDKSDTAVDKLIVSGTMVTDTAGKNIIVGEATISGTYTETDGNFTANKKVTLSGTFTNTAGTAIFTDATITGTLNAEAGVTFKGTTYVGTEPNGFPYTNFAVIKSAQKITIDVDSGVVIYGSATNAKDYFVTAKKTTFYIGDDIYAVEFASAVTTAPEVPLVILKVDFTGKDLSWYNAPIGGTVVTENSGAMIGAPAHISVYGYLVDKSFSVTFSHVQNGNWTVNGMSVDGLAKVTYSESGYKVKFFADPGYETKDVGILVNGQAISDSYVPTNGDVLTISGDVVKKNDSSSSGGLDLIATLLIIITIVVTAMAIIIALKFLRS